MTGCGVSRSRHAPRRATTISPSCGRPARLSVFVADRLTVEDVICPADILTNLSNLLPVITEAREPSALDTFQMESRVTIGLFHRGFDFDLRLCDRFAIGVAGRRKRE